MARKGYDALGAAPWAALRELALDTMPTMEGRDVATLMPRSLRERVPEGVEGSVQYILDHLAWVEGTYILPPLRRLRGFGAAGAFAALSTLRLDGRVGLWPGAMVALRDAACPLEELSLAIPAPSSNTRAVSGIFYASYSRDGLAHLRAARFAPALRVLRLDGNLLDAECVELLGAFHGLERGLGGEEERWEALEFALEYMAEGGKVGALMFESAEAALDALTAQAAASAAALGALELPRLRVLGLAGNNLARQLRQLLQLLPAEGIGATIPRLRKLELSPKELQGQHERKLADELRRRGGAIRLGRKGAQS
jgi:hypothetical protein